MEMGICIVALRENAVEHDEVIVKMHVERRSEAMQKRQGPQAGVLRRSGACTAQRGTEGPHKAHALAASVAAIAEADPRPGAYLPDELFVLSDVMNRTVALAGGDFQLTLHNTLVEAAGRPRGLRTAGRRSRV